GDPAALAGRIGNKSGLYSTYRITVAIIVASCIPHAKETTPMKSIRNTLAATGMLLLAHVPAWAAPEVNISAGSVLVDGKVAPGLAVHGHDVVAYFQDGRPMPGDARFAAVYNGATYRFASQANLDEFKAHPAKYEPAYGGYCAYGVAVGGKFD